MTDAADAPDSNRLRAGTKVEVRGDFDGSWSSGFAIDEPTVTGYRLRRRSDDEVLPGEIRAEDVRRERNSSMWWY